MAPNFICNDPRLGRPEEARKGLAFPADPNVDMLFLAPNHPSYPAAHGCGDGAAEVVLSYLFPQDVGYFRERAEEGAMSRLWAGIHFRSDIDAGLTLGQSVGQLVVSRARQDEQASPSFTGRGRP